MSAEAGNAELRKRVVTTLYSQSQEAENVETARSLPTGPSIPSGKSPPAKEDGAPDAENVRLKTKVEEVTQEMFTSMLNGLDEDVITNENLDKAVQNLFTNLIDPSKSLYESPEYAEASRGTKSTLKRLLLDAIQRSPTQQVDVTLFSDVALRCVQGDLSLFDLRKIAIDHKDLIDDSKYASIGSMMMDPVGSTRKLYQSVLRWIEKQGVKWLWSSFSTKQMYWLIAAYVLPMLTVSFIISSISTALFVGGMIAMVLTTIEIALDTEKSHFQKDYVALVQIFNKSPGKIEAASSGPTLIKYANFVVALVVALISLEFSYVHPAFYSLLFVAAVLAVVFVTFQYDLHEQPIFAYFCFAKLPGLALSILHKAIDYVPPFAFLFYPYSKISLSNDFSVYLDIATVVQVSLHLWCFMACFRKFKLSDLDDIIKPLGLLICWYTVLRFFLAKSSPQYITTLIVASFSLTLVPPLAFIFFSLSPVIFLYFYGLTAPFYYSIGFVALAFLFCLVFGFVFNYFPKFWLNLSLDYVFLISVVTCIPFALYLSSWYASLYVVPPLPVITLEEYGRYCGPQNWQANSVQTQINCLHLQGRVLSGEGRVYEASLTKVTNTKSSSIHFLPSSLQRALTCIVGETDPMCGELQDASTCVYNGCHFHSSLQYTFEVTMDLAVGEGGSVRAKMSVPDQYKSIVMALKSQSVVRFNATMVDRMGTKEIFLHATHLQHGDSDNVLDKGTSEEEEEESFDVFVVTFLRAILMMAVMVVDMLLGFLH